MPGRKNKQKSKPGVPRGLLDFAVWSGELSVKSYCYTCIKITQQLAIVHNSGRRNSQAKLAEKGGRESCISSDKERKVATERQWAKKGWGNMHQEQPAAAAGGEACGWLLQHKRRGQHHDAETQHDRTDCVLCTPHLALGERPYRSRGGGFFKLLLMLFSPNLPKRRDTSCNKSHHCKAGGAAIGHNPHSDKNSWIYRGWASPLDPPELLKLPCEQTVLSSFSNTVQ